MPTLRLERRVTADPTSTALRLSAPTAVELWPGVRRIGEIDGRLLVEAQAPVGTAEVTVRAWAPRRTPVAFVIRFSLAPSAGEPVPHVEGTLVLRYDTAQSTRAELALELDAGPELLEWVRAQAQLFLDNLAAAA